ncbi:hypothetical protein CBR_g23389 [Chara braunii]|uniref:DDE Tnp4 domain-containing protein n=1 Tax=Chara braunii TaxID=69332 RepID=A0A388L4D6_CHABU|nr:hypothetical protein CBR_g23389 [Chara braunii]|eukprot:GBG77063.1 hypothetical protein CBR_g23389 [Chara braunii]
MDHTGAEGREGGELTVQEKSLLVASLVAVCRHLQTVNSARQGYARQKASREAAIGQALLDVHSSPGVWDAPFLLSNAITAGVLPRETPRWWVKRRTGGTWNDLVISDDATADYYHDKLRMSRTVFNDIVAACAPFLQHQLTHYREPLQPDHIIAYALYRRATGETYESSTSAFSIGRATGMNTVRDVTNAILAAYPDKIAMPTGRRLLQILRVFAGKGFPNCMGAIDCTHIYVDKPANAPSKNYFDHKQQFSVVAQVVVDLDMRVLDVFAGYPGSVHDARVLRNSSLFKRTEAGDIFNDDVVSLPGGVTTTGYLLGDNGYAPRTWIVVPYGGFNQTGDVALFDTRQKTTRGVVERAFGRLKGMWRLFLRHHKTNMEYLPQQFMAVCIVHNLLLEAGIDMDEGLLMEPDSNGNPVPIDLGLQDLIHPVSQADVTEAALALRDARRLRMEQ